MLTVIGVAAAAAAATSIATGVFFGLIARHNSMRSKRALRQRRRQHSDSSRVPL